jgi:hypothetical protein
VRTYEELSAAEQRGFYPKAAQPPAGRQTVLCDSIDSLAWHLSVVGLAVLVGYGLKALLVACGACLPDSVREMRVVESIPLFPLCMVGGLVIQGLLVLCRLDALVDRGQVNRIGGASLDFLVVAAVATIRLDFIVQYWKPLVILVAVGLAWSLFGACWLARRIFLAFALLVFNAPIAAALKVFTFPVMVLFLVVECPLGMQPGIVHTLLVLNTHNLCHRVALYLVVSERIFESSYLVILDEAALLDIDECLIFFFLALCFTQTLLGIKHQDELLHLVVVQQLVAV